MKYNRSLRRLWRVKPDFESRYTLNAIYLDCDAGTAVCTDGHAMAIVDALHLIEDGEKSFLIPTDALKAADKIYTKQNAELLKNKRMKSAFPVYIRHQDNAVTVSCDGTRRSETFDAPAGRYPAWEGVLQLSGDWKAVCLDAALLSRLAESLDGIRKEQGVTLFIKDAADAILVVPTGLSLHPSLGILMPRRDTVSFPKKFWKRKDAAETAKQEEPVAV